MSLFFLPVVEEEEVAIASSIVEGVISMPVSPMRMLFLPFALPLPFELPLPLSILILLLLSLLLFDVVANINLTIELYSCIKTTITHSSNYT